MRLAATDILPDFCCATGRLFALRRAHDIDSGAMIPVCSTGQNQQRTLPGGSRNDFVSQDFVGSGSNYRVCIHPTLRIYLQFAFGFDLEPSGTNVERPG
jgi:hypothetical protein